MTWRLVITPQVQATVRALSPQIKRYVREGFEELRRSPWVGKPLRDELAGFYTFRVRRFRIIYQVHRYTITVVVAVGPRKTICGERSAAIRERP